MGLEIKMKTKINRMEKRWEEGVEHDPRSVELYKAIEKLDWDEGGDSLGLKCGGDGDIGESLMYLLDVYFEDKDRKTYKK